MRRVLALFALTAWAVPPRAKLLIIHADDLGVSHSVDRAAFAALEKGLVTSASVMVPCPWFPEVAAWAADHPDADLGLHLTLTSEWRPYRWGPVAPKDRVPSLLDPDGFFWDNARDFAAHAKPEEVETEVNAQVEKALKAGLKPTHLDSHMAALYQTPALFGVLVRVARERRIPFFAVRIPNAPPEMLAMLGEKDILFDSMAMLSPAQAKDPGGFYKAALRALTPGRHMLIVHPGIDNEELQALTGGRKDFGAAWRARDVEALRNPAFRKAVKDNQVVLTSWKDLAKEAE